MPTVSFCGGIKVHFMSFLLKNEFMIAFQLVIALGPSRPPMLEQHRNRKQELKRGGVTLCFLLSDGHIPPKRNSVFE